MNTKKLKSKIVETGQLLWEKDLVSGLNGNISVRVDADKILLTATKTCLGTLTEKDVLLMKLDGEMVDQGHVSTEKLLHIEIYKNFPDVKAVIHTHTPFANGYFLARDMFESRVFESKISLGTITAINQFTPSVVDVSPVIEVLKNNNIVALRRHGLLAMGETLFDCFLLVEDLENAVKTDAVARLYAVGQNTEAREQEKPKEQFQDSAPQGTYKLFSKEQIAEIVRLVNADPQLNALGEKTDMTMDLAVKLDETGQVFSFQFEKGRIAWVGNDENVEFVINAPEAVWRSVFNREIDPFVATTQKKMHLHGDFAKISKWYAPCSRLFELWANVPVE